MFKWYSVAIILLWFHGKECLNDSIFMFGLGPRALSPHHVIIKAFSLERKPYLTECWEMLYKPTWTPKCLGNSREILPCFIGLSTFKISTPTVKNRPVEENLVRVQHDFCLNSILWTSKVMVVWVGWTTALIILWFIPMNSWTWGSLGGRTRSNVWPQSSMVCGRPKQWSERASAFFGRKHNENEALLSMNTVHYLKMS